MLNCNDIPCKIIALGENVKATLRYDVQFKPIKSSDFFRMKFDKDRMDYNHYCKILYMKHHAS